MNHGGNVWQGGDPAAWLDYSANIRPGGPPGWVQNAILGAMDKVRYYPQLGMENAKAALAAFLGLNENQVLPTSGGISAIALAARLVASRIPERQIGLEIRRTSPFGETAIERRSFPLEGDSIRITKGSGSVIDCEWILQERLQLDGAETGLWQLSVSPIDTNLLTAIYGIGLSYKDSYGKR